MFKDRRTADTKMSVIETDPFIYIQPIALEKMGYYVKHCAKEVGWLGTADRFDGNLFVINDVFLFQQEVNATTCELNPIAIADFVTELIVANAEHGMEIANSLKVWGHSHVNMAVSPSGQDDIQVKSFKEGNDWFIRIIANKKGELEITLLDFASGIVWKDVKWMMYTPQTENLEEQIKAEMTIKVKDKVYVQPKHTSSVADYYKGKVWDEVNKCWVIDDDVYGDNKVWDKKNQCYVEKKTEQEDQIDITMWARNEDGTIANSFLLKILEPDIASFAECKSTFIFRNEFEKIYKSDLNYMEYDAFFEVLKKHVAENKPTIYVVK